MKKISIIVVALLLAACAGPGELTMHPFTMPRGEKATLVMHNQWASDWMLDQNKLSLNFIVRGDVSSDQLAAVAVAENACRIYTKTVRPNNLVAVLSSGVLYATAGYIGVGLGARSIAGAVSKQYAKYGAAASGFAGLANGTISSGGQTYTFESCGREILAMFPGYEVHVLMKSPQ